MNKIQVMEMIALIPIFILGNTVTSEAAFKELNDVSKNHQNLRSVPENTKGKIYHGLFRRYIPAGGMY